MTYLKRPILRAVDSSLRYAGLAVLPGATAQPHGRAYGERTIKNTNRGFSRFRGTLSERRVRQVSLRLPVRQRATVSEDMNRRYTRCECVPLTLNVTRSYKVEPRSIAAAAHGAVQFRVVMGYIPRACGVALAMV